MVCRCSTRLAWIACDLESLHARRRSHDRHRRGDPHAPDGEGGRPSRSFPPRRLPHGSRPGRADAANLPPAARSARNATTSAGRRHDAELAAHDRAARPSAARPRAARRPPGRRGAARVEDRLRETQPQLLGRRSRHGDRQQRVEPEQAVARAVARQRAGRPRATRQRDRARLAGAQQRARTARLGAHLPPAQARRAPAASAVDERAATRAATARVAHGNAPSAT